MVDPLIPRYDRPEPVNFGGIEWFLPVAGLIGVARCEMH
jgi:hypothetical protein